MMWNLVLYKISCSFIILAYQVLIYINLCPGSFHLPFQVQNLDSESFLVVYNNERLRFWSVLIVTA